MDETTQETFEQSETMEQSPRGKEKQKPKRQEEKSNKWIGQLKLAIVVCVITVLVIYNFQIVRDREVREEWEKKLSKVERENEALLEQVKELEVFRNETQRLQEENQQLLKELEEIKDVISAIKQEFWDQIGKNSVPISYWGAAEISQTNINATFFFLNGTKAPVEITTMRDVDIYHNNISVAYSSMLINENLRLERWIQTEKNPDPQKLQMLWKDYVPVDSPYTQKTNKYNFNQEKKDYVLSLISLNDTIEEAIYKIRVDVYDKSEDKNCQRSSEELITLLRSIGIESRMKTAGWAGPYLPGDSEENTESHAWVEVRIGDQWLEYNANGPWAIEDSLIEEKIETKKLPLSFPEEQEFSHKRPFLSVSPVIITRYKNNVFKLEYIVVPQNP